MRNQSTGRFESLGGTRVATLDLLLDEGFCKTCQTAKPSREMVVVHLRREKLYYMKPICKDCHNKRERGHRREYKRNYLRAWRKRNAQLTESYWRNEPDRKARAIARAERMRERHGDALLIQGRMRRRGMKVSVKEAGELLRRFGCCYPTRMGLTPAGLRECERIRSSLRSRPKHRRPSAFEIRLMVYEDSKTFFIKPRLQVRPYQHASERLREWQRQQKIEREQKAA